MRRWASWVDSRSHVDSDYWRRAAQAGSWRGLWNPFRIDFTSSKDGATMTGMDDEDLDVFFDVNEEAEGR